MTLTLDGKTYRIEQTRNGVRVGVVVINHIQAQHPYTRWLPRDGKRAQQIIKEANQ